ncbi:MAG: putative oxidoreductase [Alphaproteobacteria bacterium]|jgi:putative oxidoreductase|nr:putative oxidoreductase [Alphaproteobacteria bacterium]
MSVETIGSAWAPRLLSVLRIMTALLFLAHPTSKFLGFPMPMGNISIFSLFGVAGLIELVFGTLLAVGLFTRIAALILSGEMAFAYFIGHFPKSVFPLLNGGEPAVLFCFIFLYIAAAGPGPWSLDAMRERS